jgi:hypothetical protein
MNKTHQLMILGACILVVGIFLYMSNCNKEGYGTLPQMTLSRIVPYPTISHDYLTYNQGAMTNYASEDDQYDHNIIMNLGPYPNQPSNPKDIAVKDYLKANYLQQPIPQGGLYGPADISDINMATVAYN